MRPDFCYKTLSYLFLEHRQESERELGIANVDMHCAPRVLVQVNAVSASGTIATHCPGALYFLATFRWQPPVLTWPRLLLPLS